MLCFYIEIFNRLNKVEEKKRSSRYSMQLLYNFMCVTIRFASLCDWHFLLLRFVLLIWSSFCCASKNAMQFFFNWHSQKCCTSHDCIWVRSASSYNWEQIDGLSTNLPSFYVIFSLIVNSVWTFCWMDQKLSRVINLLKSWRIWFSR